MGRLSSETIEERAVMAVRNAFGKIDRISTMRIEENDRTKATDGPIEVYETGGRTKRDMAGLIETQIKGTTNKAKSKTHSKKSIGRDDLEYYLHHTSGVLFFYVHAACSDDPQVFFTQLLPFELNRLLAELERSGNRSITVKLKPFPTSTTKIEELCDNFLMHARRQATSKDAGLITLESLHELNIPVERIGSKIIHYAKDGESVFDLFKSSLPHYVYATTPTGQYITLDAIEGFDAIEGERIATVSAGPATVRTPIKLRHTEKSSSLSFLGYEIYAAEECGVVEREITFNLRGSLRERAAALDLLFALTDGHELCIDGRSMLKIKSQPSAEERKQAEKTQENILCAIALLDHLHISVDYDPTDFSEDDIWVLNVLYHCLIEKELYPSKTKIDPITSFVLQGQRILVYAEEREDSHYRLYDLFGTDHERQFGVLDHEIPEGSDEQPIEVPPMFLPSAKDMRIIPNFDVKVFAKSLEGYGSDERFFDAATDVLVKMLVAWEEGAVCRDALLQCCDILSARIFESIQDDEVSMINRYQVVVRMSGLDKMQKADLVKIAASSEEKAIQAAAHILLGNYDVAEAMIDMLPQKERDAFRSWPIYSFALRSKGESSTEHKRLAAA